MFIMKHLTLLLLSFISVFITASCQSNNVIPGWKYAKSGNISFQYPPNWAFEDETVNGQKRLTATPDAYKDIKMVRAFDIIVIPPSGRTFKDFKNNFIDIISNRGGSKAKLIKKEELKFKNYETIFAEIIEDPRPYKTLCKQVLVIAYQRRHLFSKIVKN